MTEEDAFSEIQDAVTRLKHRKANIRCSELKKVLKGFGFDIRDGRRGNHKIYTHDGLCSFTSAPFDCGHGNDAIVKPSYPASVAKNLDIYADELADFLVRRG